MSSGLGWYLDTIGRVPLLTPAEEIELGTLIRAWQDHPDGPDNCPAGIRRRGIKARDRFVHANLRLVINYITKRCPRVLKSADEDDAIQTANLALMRAAELFDPTRGYKFSTYAYWWIWQAVNKFVDSNNGPITRPAHHAALLGRISKAARDHEQITGKAPSREQLAIATGLSERQVADLLDASRTCTSLDQLIGDQLELGDLMASPAAVEPTPNLQLQKQLARLSPSDQALMSLLYGLDGPEHSAAQVALVLGYKSAGQVHARHRACLNQLRRLEQQPSQHQSRPERFSDRIGCQISLEITGHLEVVGSGPTLEGSRNLKLGHPPAIAVDQLMLLVDDA